MGRPTKGVRLHKFDHRENWYIRGSGLPDKSTGTPCLGRARASLDTFNLQREASAQLPPLETQPELLSAVRRMIRKAGDRSRLRGTEMGLTESSVLKMIEDQNNRCAVSGIEFSVTPSTSGRRMPFAPSPDRLDNSLGYTVENVRVVCAIVNLAIGDFSDAEFMRMCKGVAANNG